jgi:hypothetical protein
LVTTGVGGGTRESAAEGSKHGLNAEDAESAEFAERKKNRSRLKEPV